MSDRPATPPTRTRLSPEDRRRQLLGIGLRMLTERPIQDLSVDAVAAEAGVSRALLFRYFPTKGAYHDAVIDAAVRRVLRNTRPDAGTKGGVALAQFVRRFLEQVERRRDSYLALVYGTGSLALGGTRVEGVRSGLARTAADALDSEIDPAVLQGWIAYLETRALTRSDPDVVDRHTVDAEVEHCVAALDALRRVPPPAPWCS